MPATVTKTKTAKPVGAYTPTEIDERKSAADFLLVQVSPSIIRWHDGRTEKVSSRQLTQLQAIHTWATDF